MTKLSCKLLECLGFLWLSLSYSISMPLQGDVRTRAHVRVVYTYTLWLSGCASMHLRTRLLGYLCINAQ